MTFPASGVFIVQSNAEKAVVRLAVKVWIAC